MKLMTKAIEKRLPKLYSTENVEAEKKVAVFKFFAPWCNWRWYVVEGDKLDDGDFMFFGYVQGQEFVFNHKPNEWGYFLLSELEAIRSPFGLKIERDIYMMDFKMSEVLGKLVKN